MAILLGLALAALLAGSLCAMRAAYGIPKNMLLTGPNLKAWSAHEGKRARLFLALAMWSFPVGVVLVALAVAVTWFDEDWFPPDVQLVAVEAFVPGEADPQPYCGELAPSTPTALVIRVKTTVGKRTHAIPYGHLRGISVVTKC